MFKNIDNSIPGVSIQQISKLEEVIEGELPKDYIEYLKQYGFVSLQGRDLFGLGNDKFFNVLKETKELQDNFNLTKNFVALESVGTDVMYLVLNTSNGCVYEWVPSGEVKKIYKSFKEFIENDF
ncbi:SMI1/KNR4 family protein [Polaribacter sp. AHE13PA]|uniref:SMI1/KNR4 family protein n=1 Tax=Polaribacter sp. AHE13PA TaxID=2745562 RepID=UPI001C500B15|nr:SMI1/KNR4 family protein [Polaribacter sp. AHE13PA]QXP65737.1 SMI1/KNR4 family protein [Polaribacter sp. AHE13PA]